MSCLSSVLSQRALIRITGLDRRAFLQGLVTVDVHDLTPDRALWAGMLTPQGKYKFDFLIYAGDEALWLDVHNDSRLDLLASLNIYRLRSDVTIEDLRQTHAVVAQWNADGCAAVGEAGVADPRHPRLGRRLWGERETLAGFPSARDDYFMHRLRCGVPELMEDLADTDLFWPETGAEDMHGVDYDKGCYVGQEVTARLKHRGGLRRKIIPVALIGQPESVPCMLRTDAWDVGTLLAARNNYGLALVRLDRWHDAKASMRMIMAGSVPVLDYRGFESAA